MRARTCGFVVYALACALVVLIGSAQRWNAALAAQLVTSIELPAGSHPSGIAVRESTHRLYVAAGHSLYVIDTDTRAVAATVPAGMLMITGHLWPTPDWSALYVAGRDEQSPEQMNLKRFDVGTNTFGEAFHVGPYLSYPDAAFGPDGFLYLCNETMEEQPGYLLKLSPPLTSCWERLLSAGDPGRWSSLQMALRPTLAPMTAQPAVSLHRTTCTSWT